MGDRDAKNALFDQFARVGKALASGKRLELLDLLAQGERTVDALARGQRAGAYHRVSASADAEGGQSGEPPAAKAPRSTTGWPAPTSPNCWRWCGQWPAPICPTWRPPPAPTSAPTPNSVTRAELLQRIQTGQVTVIDVRPREEYAAGHIPAAVSIPLDELADRLAELPDDHDIVAYCRGAYCVLAHEAVRLLTDHGRSAMRLADGMLEWRLADLPVAT